MTSLLPVLLTTLLLAAQAPAIAPIRLGPTGDRLTNDDLDQIGRLSQGVGGVVWVLVGHPPMFDRSPPWYVEVYLEPDRTSSDVRRGRIQLVTASLPSGYDSVFIFECKNWKDAVDKNEIIVFQRKIADVAAQRGYFVARSFTASARAVAEADPRCRVAPRQRFFERKRFAATRYALR